MISTLLFVHLVISILLVVTILLQKTSSNGLSGIGGGNNMGIMSGRATANFLTKMTIILGAIFFCNALILGNLSSRSHDGVADQVKQIQSNTGAEKSNTQEQKSLPIAD